MLNAWGKRLRMVALAALAVLAPLSLKASEAEKPVKRTYVEAHAARLPVEQGQARLFFQRLDARTGSRQRQVLARRRACEVALVSGEHKKAQVGQVEMHG